MLAINDHKIKFNKIIALVGPTASGKTDLAIKLAKKFHGVIISADSRQIYQGLPIGTNQPDGRWQVADGKWQKVFNKQKIYLVNNIPHFFIACKKPNQRYSVVQFQKDVNKLLSRISTTNYLPILVGGTGLYASSIIEGYKFPAGTPNLKLRKKLDHLSTSTLLKKLKKIDQQTYKFIDKKNRQRIIRALEYVLLTNQSFLKAQQKNPLPNSLLVGINIPRSQLYTRINNRVEQMMRQGLFKEVKWLIKKYPRSPALKTIGYQELVTVIKNNTNLSQAIELIKQHTRQFAKRQLTWFKRMPQINWIKNYQTINKVINNFLKTLK